MSEDTSCIEVTIVRCPTSKHVEIMFDSSLPLTPEAFYEALCTFVETWNDYPQNLFKYYDQKFPHRLEH